MQTGARGRALAFVLSFALAVTSCTGDSGETQPSTTVPNEVRITGEVTGEVTIDEQAPIAGLTWTSAAVSGLPWGTDRDTVVAALTGFLGAEPNDVLEIGEPCGPLTGTRVFWRDAGVFASFDLENRFGGIYITLAAIPHAKALEVGDTFAELLEAEPGAAASGPLRVPGGEPGEVYYRWIVETDRRLADGGLTGPQPNGRVEANVYLYGPNDPFPCGE